MPFGQGAPGLDVPQGDGAPCASRPSPCDPRATCRGRGRPSPPVAGRARRPTCPSVTSRVTAFRTSSERTRTLRPRRAPGGAADLDQVPRRGQSAGEHRSEQRRQVRLAGKAEVKRFQPSRRVEQQRWRVAAQPRGEHDMPAQKIGPGALHLIQEPDCARPQQCLAGSDAPAWSLACAAASGRSARRTGSSGEQHRPLEERAAAASPPRACARLAERSSSAATSSSGPSARPGPGARPAGRGRRPDRSPRPAPGAPPFVSTATPTGRRPSAASDGGTTPKCRTPPARHSTAGPAARSGIPSCPAARHTSSASPDGSAAASCSSR